MSNHGIGAFFFQNNKLICSALNRIFVLYTFLNIENSYRRECLQLCPQQDLPRKSTPGVFYHYYRQTSNISRTSVGNKIVDHSDVVGQALLQLHLNSRLNTSNALDKDNCKTRRETFKFWDLVCFIYPAYPKDRVTLWFHVEPTRHPSYVMLCAITQKVLEWLF